MLYKNPHRFFISGDYFKLKFGSTVADIYTSSKNYTSHHALLPSCLYAHWLRVPPLLNSNERVEVHRAETAVVGVAHFYLRTSWKPVRGSDREGGTEGADREPNGTRCCGARTAGLRRLDLTTGKLKVLWCVRADETTVKYSRFRRRRASDDTTWTCRARVKVRWCYVNSRCLINSAPSQPHGHRFNI